MHRAIAVELDEVMALTADCLLSDWFRWTQTYRPKLGAPRIAPYCKQSVTSRQYDENAAYDRLHVTRMGAVDFCVSAIEVAMQQSIGCEMKSRQVKAKVWRCPSPYSYDEALAAIVPIMAKRGLFD